MHLVNVHRLSGTSLLPYFRSLLHAHFIIFTHSGLFERIYGLSGASLGRGILLVQWRHSYRVIQIKNGWLQFQDADNIGHDHKVIFLRFRQYLFLEGHKVAEAHLVEKRPALLEKLVEEYVHQFHGNQFREQREEPITKVNEVLDAPSLKYGVEFGEVLPD